MTNFKRAKEVKIFDEENNQWKGVKGLVNEANIEERFAIVGENYKVVQHEEVNDIITKALNDLELKHINIPIELNEGARLRIDLKFPDVIHSIAGETIQLWSTFDNSYDCSTGLRLEIGAYLPSTDTNLYCSEIISEKLNKYYHKHTKGLEVKMLEGTISEGIKIFQEKIGAEFQLLADTPCSTLDAKNLFNNLIEENNAKKNPAKKYLTMINESLDGADITSCWGLYKLVSSIFNREISNVDLRSTNARKILNQIKSMKRIVIVQQHDEQDQEQISA